MGATSCLEQRLTYEFNSRRSRSDYYYGVIEYYVWELYFKNVFLRDKDNYDIFKNFN